MYKAPKILSHDYTTAHDQVERARGKAAAHICFFCLKRQGKDWARLRGTDGRRIYHYVPACRKCHRPYDSTPEAEMRRGSAWRGKKRPPEFGEHMSRVLSGRVFSDETKQRMSEGQKRLAMDPEHRTKLSERGRKGALARWGKK